MVEVEIRCTGKKPYRLFWLSDLGHAEDNQGLVASGKHPPQTADLIMDAVGTALAQALEDELQHETPH